MLIAIDTIHESPGNARVVPAGDAADAALRESIQQIGLLQPVLVVADGDRWELRAGARRLKACRALGMSEVEAVVLEPSGYGGTGSEVPETAMSAAENMVRAPMHPVDQWRAIAALRTSHAYTLETAAAALGVPMVLARRMEHLGNMAPELLDAIGTGSLPEHRDLRLIAMAPHDVQVNALSRVAVRDSAGRINWRMVADGCTIRRIPQSRAIFDPAAIAWDEDLFAEPDEATRFTTTDVAEFLSLQRAALAAQSAKSKGRIEVVPYDDNSKLPKGWQLIYDDMPKRWRKDDVRKAFAMLTEEGFRIGQVTYTMAAPIVAPVRRVGESGTDVAKSARPPIAKATQSYLASVKKKAVTTRLTEIAPTASPPTMLKALLLLFTCQNVVANGLAGSRFSSIAHHLVDPDGQAREVSDRELCEMAAWMIDNTIEFDHPNRPIGSASGVGAEWLATMLEAEMPRTDTPDILRGIVGAKLIEIAEQHGVSAAGTIGTLRKRLAGALPDWRATTFGAPGPKAGTTPDDLIEDGDDPDFAEVPGAETDSEFEEIEPHMGDAA
jgi:ParB family chromosome partitioning protein